MRTGTQRLAALAIVVALGFGMSGCVGGDPMPTLPPTPDSTPIFASEEEALAAAEAAYAAYSEVAGQIANDGGGQPERISPYVTARQLQNELDTAAYYERNGYRVAGEPSVMSVVLQQYLEAAGAAEITIYVCLDVTTARVFDQSGVDVTPSNRQEVGALEVVLVGRSAAELQVDSSELWSDSSFCR